MCTYNFYRWCHDQFNKNTENTDREYLEEMKTFMQTDLTPNKQGYTPERHPTKKQKVGKTELNYDSDDTNSGKLVTDLFSNNEKVNLDQKLDSNM